jgi:hypothetical protein
MTRTRTRTLLALGGLALGVAAGCTPQRGLFTHRAVSVEQAGKPTCTTDHGYRVGGTLVVTILHTEETACDLTGGMQLNLVWNAETEGAGWGGDASVARARSEALDAGCTPQWVNDGDYRLVGVDCDF